MAAQDHDLGKSGHGNSHTTKEPTRQRSRNADRSEATVALLDADADDLICDLSLTDTTHLRSPHLVVANAGDHAAIHHFLVSVFQAQAPSDESFAASLDDPLYEPSDRLLVRRGSQILAHLHLTNRMLQYGDLRIPAAGAHWLATLDEFRNHGFATRLLDVSEDLMREDGIALGFLRTSNRQFFERRGWAVCGLHCKSTANPRSIKAHLTSLRSRRAARRITVRPWRQVELPALSRIYRDNLDHVVGTFDRSEPYWRWLMSSRDFDHVFVAFDGPGKLELDGENSNIIGYCMLKNDNIIELMVSPNHPLAAIELLHRAVSEAIEDDRHAITLHSPPRDTLHEIFRRADGVQSHQAAHAGQVNMMRLLDPVAFLSALCPELHRRATAVQLTRPCELGIVIDNDELILSISRRSVKIRNGRLPRSVIRTDAAEFTRLLFGHHGAAHAIDAGQIDASTRVARQLAEALFPQLVLWRSPVDHWDV